MWEMYMLNNISAKRNVFQKYICRLPITRSLKYLDHTLWRLWNNYSYIYNKIVCSCQKYANIKMKIVIVNLKTFLEINFKENIIFYIFKDNM